MKEVSSDPLDCKHTMQYLFNTMDLEVFRLVHIPVDLVISLGEAVMLTDRSDGPLWLSTILRKTSQDRNEAVVTELHRKVWRWLKESSEPRYSLMSELVDISPWLIESEVFDILDKANNVDQINPMFFRLEFERTSTWPWLRLCVMTPSVFQISVQCMNILMMCSKGSDKTLRMLVTVFHKAIRQQCTLENVKLASLYPEDIRGVVDMLERKPGVNRTRDRALLERLADLVAYNRRTAVCLLSHFPQWIPLFFKFCEANGEARIVSLLFLATDMFQTYIETM